MPIFNVNRMSPLYVFLVHLYTHALPYFSRGTVVVAFTTITYRILHLTYRVIRNPSAFVSLRVLRSILGEAFLTSIIKTRVDRKLNNLPVRWNGDRTITTLIGNCGFLFVAFASVKLDKLKYSLLLLETSVR